MPLTVGPGAIAIAIAVGAGSVRSEAGWMLPAAAVLACGFLAAIIYLTYRFAEPVGRVLGETSMSVLIRLSAFLLVCIGVQITWSGASALLRMVFGGA
jgi:multiple antibiotic resistance protein